MNIIVKSQAEWDALPKSFSEFTVIEIRATEQISISSNPGNSSAVLWESSHAELRGSSSAVLWESSRAVLWESSRAELWESSVAYNYSTATTLLLFSYAVAFLFNGAKAKKKSKTASIVVPKSPSKVAVESWLEEYGVECEGGCVTLFKRVSNELKTQENTVNETLWKIGTTLEHPNWKPKDQECGPGKFHAVPMAYLGDEYRSEHGDRYVAIKIAVKDLYAWPKDPEHPRKIAFRKGTVFFECNRWGEKLEEKE